MSRPADRQPSMASRLRAREAAALQRALDSERSTARAAQERCQELQKALDGERSAGRALRREVAAQAKAVREEEARKYAALLEQLKMRMELVQREAVAAEKESLTRALTAEFHRELQARQDEWRRETKRQVELLQDQLREQQRVAMETPPHSEVEALVHSLHAEFHRDLHQKQEEWRREHKAQVETLTTQLRELQRLYTDTCNKLTTTTNEAENIPKLRQEIHTLKLHNKELEEKIQMLTEADRRKVEEFRAQHEENSARVVELQKSARKETFQLLEEMKSKDRVIAQLQREYHLLATRLGGGPSAHGSPSAHTRSRVTSEASLREPERPGEQPRLCIKRPKQLSFASDVNKRLRAQEGRKPPDPPGPDVVTTKKEDEKQTSEKSNSNSWEPVNEKDNAEMETSDIINSWTKKVGLETLYQLLLDEHQVLQRSHVAAVNRLREEERARCKLEQQLRDGRRRGGGAEGDNVINLALAEQISELQRRVAELEAEAAELREQNDLLEFRILELDDGVSSSSFHFKSPSSRSPDTRDREIDDVSDSGVMSLPTSEDISEADFQDFKMEPNNRDVKSKLAQLCQSLESVSERISVQQALSLLRHYESRLENLEATLAAMCQEAAQTKNFDHLPSANMEHAKSPSRIIATVLPFTDLSSSFPGRDVKDDMPLKRLLRDQDCMQESGIFEDNGLTSCVLNVGTQTDWTFDPPPGDLGAEIRKLTRIRERIEEKGGNKKLLKTEADSEFLTHTSIKELLFFRERVQILEEKLAIYESRGDEQSRLLALRLEKEVLLAAQINHLQSTLRKLKEQNRILEEEKCEFEEAENDTRLRCQKLEVKLSALGEKKSGLQVQLQQNARTMANLRSTLSEEERKRNEARQYAAKMEALVNKLEQQNFEMEEKEMEVRYRLHTLENIVPAMVMYYLWRMLNAVRPYLDNGSRKISVNSSTSDTALLLKPNIEKKNLDRFSSTGLPTHQEKENLRKSLEDIEKFLTLKQKGEAIEQPIVSGTASAAFLVIEELSNKCQAMDDRIKELELKEKVYQATVQKGDEILNKMEDDYKQQLKNLEDELNQKQADIKKAEAQIRKLSSNSDLETQFQERVNQLENEIAHLKGIIAQKDKEKKALEERQERLMNELEDATDKLKSFKEDIEKPLREEVDIVKRKMRDLLGDLDQREQEKEEADEMHRNLVKELKAINNQACRELEESEVTIGELKEEVQTLEKEVQELRAALSHERDSKERLMIAVGRERQQREVASDSSSTGSLQDELQAAELPVDDLSTVDVAASYTPPACSTSRPSECQKAAQVIKDFDPSGVLAPNFLDRVTSAFQHSKGCWQCKNSNALELRHILSTLQKTAPQSKMSIPASDQVSVLDPSLGRQIKSILDSIEKYSGSNQSSPSLTVTRHSGLSAAALSSLVAKCRVKDHMIRCLADQLRLTPWLCDDLLKSLGSDPAHTYDFNRISLYEYITGAINPFVTESLEGAYDPGYSSTNPLILQVVDKPDPLSLRVAWTSPSSNIVAGFQVTVEGQVCEKIYSTARTSTILHPLDLRSPVTVTISALQRDGAVVQEHSVRYPS